MIKRGNNYFDTKTINKNNKNAKNCTQICNMILRCTITKEVRPGDKFLIVQFEQDLQKRNFEVKFNYLNLYENQFKKWDYLEINVKTHLQFLQNDIESYNPSIIGSNPKNLNKNLVLIPSFSKTA